MNPSIRKKIPKAKTHHCHTRGFTILLSEDEFTGCSAIQSSHSNLPPLSIGLLIPPSFDQSMSLNVRHPLLTNIRVHRGFIDPDPLQRRTQPRDEISGLLCMAKNRCNPPMAISRDQARSDAVIAFVIVCHLSLLKSLRYGVPKVSSNHHKSIHQNHGSVVRDHFNGLLSIRINLAQQVILKRTIHVNAVLLAQRIPIQPSLHPGIIEPIPIVIEPPCPRG